jgi:cytochrome c oxidase assembly protein subunit 11
LTLSIVPSVSPGLAADNIKKIQCFCFSEQTLGPYETQEWPIRFYVDSELTENVNDVYLSYTLFEKEREEAVAVNHEH